MMRRIPSAKSYIMHRHIVKELSWIPVVRGACFMTWMSANFPQIYANIERKSRLGMKPQSGQHLSITYIYKRLSIGNQRVTSLKLHAGAKIECQPCVCTTWKLGVRGVFQKNGRQHRWRMAEYTWKGSLTVISIMQRWSLSVQKPLWLRWTSRSSRNAQDPSIEGSHHRSFNTKRKGIQSASYAHSANQQGLVSHLLHPVLNIHCTCFMWIWLDRR